MTTELNTHTSRHIQQFVMAYGVEQDRMRAILPEGFESLRPVIRINAESRDRQTAYVEVNTAVASAGRKGWLNIKVLGGLTFERKGDTTTFKNDQLEISFTKVASVAAARRKKTTTAAFISASTRNPLCLPRKSMHQRSSATAASAG